MNKSIIERFNQIKGKRDLLIEQANSKTDKLNELDVYFERLNKARWVLSEVSKLTQEKFKNRVEKLVTMAIKSVFNRDFEFVLDFQRKRNKLEIEPLVFENGFPYSPKSDMGGGILDVIGFALRIVLWSLENPKSRNVLILDEPGKWTGSLIIFFGKIIKEISKSLNIQIIMVTHDESLIQIADRAWRVEHNGIKSNVIQLDDNENIKLPVKKLRKIRR